MIIACFHNQYICWTISQYLKFVYNFTLSEKTIKGNVERVIKIWEERKLFEKDYLESLRSKLGMVICFALLLAKSYFIACYIQLLLDSATSFHY